MNGWLVFSLLFLAGTLFLVTFILVTFQKEKGTRRQRSILQKYFGKRVNLHRLNTFYQKSYVHIQRVPGLRRYVFKIRKRLELLQAFDEYSLRRQTMQITFSTLGISCLLIVGLLIFNHSLIAVLWILLGILFLNGMLIDTFVNRVEDRLLKKSIIFFEDNRNFFQERKNVEDALFQALEIAPHAIDRQGKRIYDVLTATDNKTEMNKYYEVAPNRFLKLFASFAFLVHEYGDRVVEKKSMYLHALSELIRDTNLELTRRDKLNYRLKGLSTIAVAPILFIGMIESWATNNFPIMMDYYRSRVGFLTLVSIFLVVLICYIGIRKMLENDELRYQARSKRWRWEQTIYQLPIIRQIVNRLTPKRHTRTHYALTKLIKDANSPLTLEWLTVRRLLIALTTFVFTIALFFYLHTVTIHNVLYNPFHGVGFFGAWTPEEQQRAMEQTEFDRQIIQELKEVQGPVDTDKVIEKLREDDQEIHTDLTLLRNAQRIINKYNVLQVAYFKWWELGIGLIATYFAYYVPVWILRLQKRIRAMDLQSEVDQLHSILSVLVHFERIDVETMLEWMDRFSVILKEPIHRCLMTYSSGPLEALDRLELDVSFEPFQRIVQKLKLSVEKISIQDAFDDLEMTRLQSAQQREEQFMRSIEQKSFWGYGLGFTPMLYIVVVYLVVPMLYLSTVQMRESIFHLQGL